MWFPAPAILAAVAGSILGDSRYSRERSIERRFAARLTAARWKREGGPSAAADQLILMARFTASCAGVPRPPAPPASRTAGRALELGGRRLLGLRFGPPGFRREKRGPDP
jgi:hypothetical protein